MMPEKPEHCRNQSCEQHCVMTKQLTPCSERCFLSYGGILLQFATAKKRQAMESVYIYSIGEDGHSFLTGAVSRISVIDRVPPGPPKKCSRTCNLHACCMLYTYVDQSSRLHLNKQKNKQGIQGIFQNSRFTQTDYSTYC